MSQILRPASTLSVSDCTTTTPHLVTDEVTPNDDTDYVQSSSSYTTDGICTMGLGPSAALPLADEDGVLRFRGYYEYTRYSKDGTTSYARAGVKVEVLIDGVSVASGETPHVNDTWSTVEVAIPAADLAGVDSLSDIVIKATLYASYQRKTTGEGRVCIARAQGRLTWVEVELPDKRKAAGGLEHGFVF